MIPLKVAGWEGSMARRPSLGQVIHALRRLGPEDADAVADVFARSRATAMPWLPTLHTVAENRAFFAAETASSVGWGAFTAAGLAGFALVRAGWLNHLYVSSEAQGAGIGSALLARSLAHAGGDLQLWTFQRNGRARAFYARRGFVEAELTDGSGNEEGEPDVRLRFPAGA
jgi:GNAT superfamily N-acetyltransferase